jgi:alcohol dehydrogenase class IV
MSNAMLLPAVTAWSLPGAPERYAEAARVMGFASTDDNQTVALERLVEGLQGLCRDLDVPLPQQFGIDEQEWFEAIPTMAAQAIDSGSPANNPRLGNASDFAALYAQVWRGEVATQIP